MRRRLIRSSFLVALLTVGLGAASPVRAEPSPLLPSPVAAVPLVIGDDPALQPGRARLMRDAGIGLVVAGAAGIVAGSLLFTDGVRRGCFLGCPQSHFVDQGPGEAIAGLSLLAVGSAGFLTGAVLWPAGQARLNRLKRAGVQLSVLPTAAPAGSSLRIDF